MKHYYQKSGVKRAIIDFVHSGSDKPIRECAFYNNSIEQIQRKSPNPNDNSVLVLDSEEKISTSLRNGAKAFYASVWHYSNPHEPSEIRGRDITWTIKSVEGGLSITKKVTQLFLEALKREGFPQPLVKYSGKLGFDILIPKDQIQSGSPEDLDFLADLHRDLTKDICNYITEHSSFSLEDESSTVKLTSRMGTCLLTELRWRRGLLLTPMSLHPGSGLVSVPLLSREIPNFSVVDASPEKVHAREWSISSNIPGKKAEPSVLHSPKGTPVKA
ncbi:hypothetical protein AKJ52_01435 [candidate division MSBL1 archaeon SCGC-AAA382C18]|uniref:Uncharacterized protein n=1 Tax=candidate division MSBL1 archaeon SCGC-AAA382C18 TaxID=1698281 RepID=A0A133VK76_9EURY|nr:hypothetical protein AKJ52_01435 [candidate division MSBL1 archaeon SCGC-AAA382C18]